MTKVFFDASVIFSAIYSSTGASNKLIQLVKSGYIIGLTTQTVIEEVERNTVKFKDKINIDPGAYVAKNNFLIREQITGEEIEEFKRLVDPKDAHVLAGAKLTKSDYLVTLDKKHINNAKIKNIFPHSQIISPKEFLEIIVTR